MIGKKIKIVECNARWVEQQGLIQDLLQIEYLNLKHLYDDNCEPYPFEKCRLPYKDTKCRFILVYINENISGYLIYSIVNKTSFGIKELVIITLQKNFRVYHKKFLPVLLNLGIKRLHDLNFTKAIGYVRKNNFQAINLYKKMDFKLLEYNDWIWKIEFNPETLLKLEKKIKQISESFDFKIII